MSDWMKLLLRFGFVPSENREELMADPDVKLVPGVCEKIVIPWIESQLVTLLYFEK